MTMPKYQECNIYGNLQPYELFSPAICNMSEQNIPVVVVNAMDITKEERDCLNGHIETVYQKASLPPRKYVDQLIQFVEDKSGS